MSKTTCRATLERRNRRYKSDRGTTQESNHSGRTTEPEAPTQSPGIKETKRPESNKAKIEDDVLIIDDDIEMSIRKECLTLPRCVEKKINDIRQIGITSTEGRQSIVIL